MHHRWSAALVVGVLALATGPAARGQSATLWISANANDTAGDAPQDGIFDEFFNPGYASIGNNGYADVRGRIGFPMGEVPGGATIASASLNLVVSNFAGTRSLAIYGRGGNCTAELSDFTEGVQLATVVLGPSGTITVVTDVTAVVADARATAAPCLEIVIREAPPNDANYELIFATATLVVELSGDATRTIDIDVKPASMPNSINRLSGGLVTVAALSSPEFDARTLDLTSLTFGRVGTEPSLARCDPSPEDVNEDGLDDVICHFSTSAAGFLSPDTMAILEGRTVTGGQVRGTDSVRIVR